MKKGLLEVGILITGLIFFVISSWTVYAQDEPSLVIENAQGNVGSTVTADLVLANAPEGLQQYAFTITIENPAIASYAEIIGVEISGQLFQISQFDNGSVEFRALDLNNDVRPGDENIVLARLTLNVLAIGTTPISLDVGAYVDDRGIKIDPQVQSGQLIVPQSNASTQPPETTPPTTTPPTTTAPPTTNLPQSTAPRVIPPSTSLPRDLNEDGLFEDINGDGVLNPDDVALLLGNLNSTTVQEDKAFFDFNQDGVLNNADVTILLSIASGANTPTTPPVTQPQPETQQATVLQVNGSRANVNETSTVSIVLSQAPQGLERFEFRVSLSPSGIARIASVQSVALASNFVEVVSQSDNEIHFRGADFSNAIQPGAQNVLLAQLELQGLAPGSTQISVSVELFTGEDSQRITPTISPVQVEFFQGPPALDPQANPPKDLDGDGLFEDVNGDGVFDTDDALLLAFNIDSAIVVSNVQFFDFNGDGRISFEDAARLNQMVS